MRAAVIVVSLSLALGAAYIAFAADMPKPPEAPKADMKPPAPLPGAPFQEPDLKHPPKPNSYLVKDAPLPGDFVIGKITAPIMMIEYASMSCPHCAQFSNTVLPELQKKYIDTGNMRYILRQFPLNEPALKAGMLLQCIGEQNTEKYYVFAHVLFESQAKWAFDTNFLSSLETIATVGGISKEQFASCTGSTDREMRLLQAKKTATDELKIPHTPYIIIGGEPYEGDRTVEAISQVIDAKLDKIGK